MRIRRPSYPNCFNVSRTSEDCGLRWNANIRYVNLAAEIRRLQEACLDRVKRHREFGAYSLAKHFPRVGIYSCRNVNRQLEPSACVDHLDSPQDWLAKFTLHPCAQYRVNQHIRIRF